jgi:hypothetical protein
MRRLILGVIAAICISLSAGPVLAQHPKLVHKKDQQKKKKKGKKGKKGKKPIPKPAPKPVTIFGEKGTWTIGGSGAIRADFLRGEVSGKKYWTGPFQFRVASVVSYFVIFLYTKNHVKKAADQISLNGGAMLGLMYNHKLQGTLFLTAGADAHLLGGKTKTENRSAELKTFNWFLGPRLGLTLAFGGRYGGFFRVLGFFDYGGRKYTTEPGGAEKDDDIMNFGVQTALGIFF